MVAISSMISLKFQPEHTVEEIEYNIRTLEDDHPQVFIKSFGKD